MSATRNAAGGLYAVPPNPNKPPRYVKTGHVGAREKRLCKAATQLAPALTAALFPTARKEL